MGIPLTSSITDFMNRETALNRLPAAAQKRQARIVPRTREQQESRSVTRSPSRISFQRDSRIKVFSKFTRIVSRKVDEGPAFWASTIISVGTSWMAGKTKSACSALSSV